MKKIAMLIFLLCYSCIYKPKQPLSPISFIKTFPMDKSKIRFDGFYNNSSLDSLKLCCKDYNNATSYEKVIFLENKKIKSDYFSVTIGNEPFTCEHYQNSVKWHKENKKEYLGDFTIKNDSIYAYVPIYLPLTGHRFVQINFNYRGYLKNKDTITNWKVIPPYPADITKIAVSLNPRLFKPQTLYFVKTDAVKCLQMD
jgi:hypothetical protein